MANPCRYRAKSRHPSPLPPLAFPRRQLRSNRGSSWQKLTNRHHKTTAFIYTDITCIAETKYWSLMANPCRYRAKSRHLSPHPSLAFPRRHLGSNRDASRQKISNRHHKTTSFIYTDITCIAETKYWSLMAKPCRYRAKSRHPSPLPPLAFPRRHLGSNRESSRRKITNRHQKITALIYADNMFIAEIKHWSLMAKP